MKLPEAIENYLKQLSSAEKAVFEAQCSSVDWNLITELVHDHVPKPSKCDLPLDAKSLKPADFIRLPQTEPELADWDKHIQTGNKMLTSGQVGVILVAGGQGSRLGFEGPKGTYPIGGVSGASLFYFHARKIKALELKHGKPLPLLVMTSPENDADTRIHFKENRYFGLNPSHVRFFIQGQLPAVDSRTGELLFSGPGKLALAPDGHGGCLFALARIDDRDGQSALQWAEAHGVKTFFYFQVDNPLVKIADAAFLGLHHQSSSEVSFKVVSKQFPEEKVGVVCQTADKRQCVIEYSDLPADLANLRDSTGSLSFRAGSIAIHLFELSFLKKLVTGATRLPFHKALKKVNYWDFSTKRLITPTQLNAIKFEAFIFDTLPLAERSLVVETDRAEEFEPLKNATGPDSPATVRDAMTRLAADFLESISVQVPRDATGKPLYVLELDPCLMNQPDAVLEVVGRGKKITQDTCIKL